jgi:hypothetical protein
MNATTGLSRRCFLGLSMGALTIGGASAGRSEPWRVDRMRIPELQSMGERLGCFDLTDQMPRDRYIFLAHVMTYGTSGDVVIAKRHFSDDEFLDALKNAPIGVFDRYSWAYWNTVLGRVPVPPIPKG